jgi:hypothetical protein
MDLIFSAALEDEGPIISRDEPGGDLQTHQAAAGVQTA